jgi:hypothetical protein
MYMYFSAAVYHSSSLEAWSRFWRLHMLHKISKVNPTGLPRSEVC